MEVKEHTIDISDGEWHRLIVKSSKETYSVFIKDIDAHIWKWNATVLQTDLGKEALNN